MVAQYSVSLIATVGMGITNFLFLDRRRQVLCNRVEQVFPNKECTFSMAGKGTGDEYVSPIMFLPKIQLKQPENWDDIDDVGIAYKVPWPVTGTADNDGGKIHSAQILRNGDI